MAALDSSADETTMTPLWVAQLSLKEDMRNRTVVPQTLSRMNKPGEDVVKLLSLANDLRLYFVPFLISTGIAFNIICCFGFTKTKLKKRFFNQLFLTISVANMGFLMTLLLIWIQEQGVDIYAVPGMCPIVIFLSHFFPFLSFWTSIMAAILLLLQPHIRMINKFARGWGRGKIVSICLSVFSFTVYLYKTWTNGVLIINGVRYCTVLPETQDAMKVLNIMDVMFLLLLPFIGFIAFDVLIVMRYTKCFFKVRESSDGRPNHVSRDALCVVISQSVCFILFVGPGCLSKLYFYLKGNGPHYSIRNLLLQNLFQYSLYTYFALTPLVHMIVSRSFRSQSKHALCGAKGRPNRHLINFVQPEMPSEQTLL